MCKRGWYLCAEWQGTAMSKFFALGALAAIAAAVAAVDRPWH